MRVGEWIGGRFVVERHAGSGGMGEVYRAHDRETGETVALKFLQHTRGSEFMRFKREAQVLAELLHPGIVRFVAHGTEAGGALYIAMEWVEGEDLEARLSRGPLSIEESIALTRRVADALSAAHERGIIHRDLKPKNLLLVGGDVTQVKVLDFGIARIGNLPPVTHAGTVLGTPGYMAPEQVKSSSSIDVRADIFTLGCVLFECLTAKPAFAGAHFMAALAKILFEEAPRVRDLRPETPASLDALVAQMLAKHPSARPRDASAVVAALDALRASLDTAAVSSARRVAQQVAPAGLTRSERRLMSVVFAQGREADEGASVDVSPDADEPLLQAAKAWGGRAERLEGGSVIITLSSSGTHTASDLAVQAARCALAVRAVAGGRPVSLAIGRGESSGRSALGHVIDQAIALLDDLPPDASHAPPGGRGRPVRIDEITAGLLDSRFVVTRGQVGLLLEEERSSVSFDIRTLFGKPTPFVGREREIGELEALLIECIESQTARAVLVTAPCGAGKSRLAHELIRKLMPAGEGGEGALSEPFNHLPVPMELWFARGDSVTAGSTFNLLSQVLRRAAGIHEGEPLETRQNKLLARVAQQVSPADRRWVSEFLGELIGTPLPDEESASLRAARQDINLMGEQMRRAWEAFLRAELSARPLLFIIDDLQWGDLPSVQFIDTALRSMRRRPWMVIAFARPYVHEIFRRLWSDANPYELALGELPPKAALRFVANVLGARASPETAQRIVAQAAGNAFYLEELVRAVAENRAHSLPETVIAMVQARIDGLESEARRMLRAASIFGDVFRREAMTALLGDSLPTASADDWLGSLVEREILVRRAEDRYPGEPEFAFGHVLLREGAYATLTDEDRVLGHQLAGAWLEAHGESDPLVLAEHFEKGGDALRAARHYLRAAEQAQRAGDMANAVACARRGIACHPPPEVRVPLLSLVCDAFVFRAIGDPEMVQHDAEALLSLAPSSAPARAKAQAARLLSLLPLGDPAKLAAALHGFAKGSADPEELEAAASALGVVGLSTCMDGRLLIASATLTHLQTLSDKAPRSSAARLWERVLLALYEPYANEDPYRGLVAANEALAVGPALGHELGHVSAKLMRGLCLLFLGAASAAQREFAEIGNQSDAISRFAGLHLFGWASALSAVGDFTGADQRARQLIERGQVQKDLRLQGLGHFALADSLSRREQFEDAAPEAAQAVELLTGAPFDRIGALSLLAHILLRLSRESEAVPLAEEALKKLTLLSGSGFCRGVAVRLTYAEAMLALHGRDRARPAIMVAKRRLLAMSASVTDPALRQDFLMNVPENVRTFELATRIASEVIPTPR